MTATDSSCFLFADIMKLFFSETIIPNDL